MKKYAIIVAAGSGTRFGAELPKQFLCIDDIPIFIHSINKFLNADPSIEIVLVIDSKIKELVQELLSKHDLLVKIKLTDGGDTRSESVQKGLAAIGEEGIVLIHDAARPFVSEKLIQSIYEVAKLQKAVVPIVPVADSMIHINGDTVDRSEYYTVQTPQGFDVELLKKAYSIMDKKVFTDDASLLRALGIKVYTIDGETGNIKITYNDALTVRLLDKIQ